MGYLPIMMDLGGKPCAIIGGGSVAEAKLKALLAAGASVTVISPTINRGIGQAVESGSVRHLAREYRRGDLHGYRLAFVAAGNPEVARTAAAEAAELGIPINAADQPEFSSFISPASIARGALRIAISTDGASPAVARMVRAELEKQIGPEYARLVELMRGARRYLMARGGSYRERARVLNALAPRLLEAIQSGLETSVEAVLRTDLDADMAQLGIDAPELSEARVARA